MKGECFTEELISYAFRQAESGVPVTCAMSRQRSIWGE